MRDECIGNGPSVAGIFILFPIWSMLLFLKGEEETMVATWRFCCKDFGLCGIGKPYRTSRIGGVTRRRGKISLMRSSSSGGIRIFIMSFRTCDGHDEHLIGETDVLVDLNSDTHM